MDDCASWYERGAVLSYLHHHEAAIASYDRAFEFGHNHAQTWYMRGESCSAIGDLESALESYEQACTLQPDNSAIWYAKGCIWKRYKLLLSQIFMLFYMMSSSSGNYGLRISGCRRESVCL